MTPPRIWTTSLIIGLNVWLILSPAINLPGLVKGLPWGIGSALGSALVLAVVDRQL